MCDSSGMGGGDGSLDESLLGGRSNGRQQGPTPSEEIEAIGAALSLCTSVVNPCVFSKACRPPGAMLACARAWCALCSLMQWPDLHDHAVAVVDDVEAQPPSKAAAAAGVSVLLTTFIMLGASLEGISARS